MKGIKIFSVDKYPSFMIIPPLTPCCKEWTFCHPVECALKSEEFIKLSNIDVEWKCLFAVKSKLSIVANNAGVLVQNVDQMLVWDGHCVWKRSNECGNVIWLKRVFSSFDQIWLKLKEIKEKWLFIAKDNSVMWYVYSRFWLSDICDMSMFKHLLHKLIKVTAKFRTLLEIFVMFMDDFLPILKDLIFIESRSISFIYRIRGYPYRVNS